MGRLLALVASLVAGASSIIALTTFFVSAQVALPDWVRGRGLAIFLTVYFGALTLGSAIWGEVATAKGVPFALYAAGAAHVDRQGAHMAMEAANRRGGQSDAVDALACAWLPSIGWPTIEGPILAIAEYRIDPKDSSVFLAVMQDIGLERRRDGAYAWHMFEDPDEEGKMVETYLIHSALELKYRQARVTMADQMIEDGANQFLKAPATTRYLVGPQRGPRSSWRKRIGAAYAALTPVTRPAP